MTEQEKLAIERLKKDSVNYGCGKYLKSIGEFHRWEIYTFLEFERLERKYNDLIELYKECGSNWSCTIFSMFFQLLGIKTPNAANFLELSERVSYNPILRERSDPYMVEALLLGASGLLDIYPDDHYTLKLKRDASYLLRKYRIEPMNPYCWVLSSSRPISHPILRLAQAATLFSTRDFLLDDIVACRSLSDVEDIFHVSASGYWNTHYLPAKESEYKPKTLGRDKCNVIGINLVVMIQYAYSYSTSNAELRDRAQNLLEDLRPEVNTKIKSWLKYGFQARSAFETQALLQLSEYCDRGACERCNIKARTVNDLSWIDEK